MKTKYNRQLYRTILTLVTLTMMAAFASSVEAAKEDTVGVAVESLNYSGKEVAYIAVEKPGDPNSGGGGDALNPYSSGGTICCFSIPKTWHPELKVVIKYQFYPETEYRRQLVSVGPYAGGKPGDIWLIVHADESVEAVVSDFGPTREEWPGKVKGYPVPSREYLLKRWSEKLRMEKAELKIFETMLNDNTSSKSPEVMRNLKDAIEFTKKVIDGLERNKP